LLFWRWNPMNYLTGLASNLDPPNCSLPSSYDYRHEPTGPSLSLLWIEEYIFFWTVLVTI
jgi:hypothetical protein